MPDIAQAPAAATSPTANASPAAAGKTGASAAGDDSGSATPFGALLRKIVAQAGGEGLRPAIAPEKIGAGDTAENGDGAALPLDAAGLAALLSDMSGHAAADAAQAAARAGDDEDAADAVAASAGSGQGGTEAGQLLAAPVTQAAPPAAAEMAEAGADAPAAANAADAPATIAAMQADDGNAVESKAPAAGEFAAAPQLPAAGREATAHMLQQPSAAAAPAPAARIETPVGAPQWNNEFSDRVAWMVGRNESRAELVLNPPQLGRIEVSLSVSGDQASALFVAASPGARDAIENALPRLREVLADAGIQLGQAQVGSESPQQSPNGKENKDNQPQGLALGHDGKPMPAGFAVNSPGAWLSSGRGMIDVFA